MFHVKKYLTDFAVGDIEKIIHYINANFEFLDKKYNFEGELAKFNQLNEAQKSALTRMGVLSEKTIPKIENDLNQIIKFIEGFKKYQTDLEGKIKNIQCHETSENYNSVIKSFKKVASNVTGEIRKLNSSIFSTDKSIDILKIQQCKIVAGLNSRESENKKMEKQLQELVDENKKIVQEKIKLISENLLLREELKSLRGARGELQSLEQVVQSVRDECANVKLEAEVKLLEKIVLNNTKELKNLRLNKSAIEQNLNNQFVELTNLQNTATELETSLKEIRISGNVTIEASLKDLEKKMKFINDFYQNQTHSNSDIIEEISNNLDNLNNELQKLKNQMNKNDSNVKDKKLLIKQ